MDQPGGTKWKVWVGGTLTAGLAFSLTSCGTLLYPERRGQPVGRLDLGVVALDGVGLLLFFVPGVIAFVVDFATGAIFLPPEYSLVTPPTGSDLRMVRVDPAELTPGRVEAVVREHTGRAVSLRPGEYRAKSLQKLDEFTPETLAGLQADSNATEVIFRADDE
jgi:hypothetical protein